MIADYEIAYAQIDVPKYLVRSLMSIAADILILMLIVRPASHPIRLHDFLALSRYYLDLRIL
jgi:hypothetical protein